MNNFPRQIAIIGPLLLSLAACAGTAPTSTYSTGPSAPKAGLSEITVIPGTCHRLIAGGKDATSVCADKAMLSTTENGRVQIVATMTSGSSIMFTGPDLPNPDANSDAFRVDQILLSSPALTNGPRVSPAVGYCKYTNPYTAPMRIACSADIGGLNYEMAFTASGLMR